MSPLTPMTLRPGETVPTTAIPVGSVETLGAAIVDAAERHQRLAALFAVRESPKSLRLHAILADDENGLLHVAAGTAGESFASLTPRLPQAHLFEREIAEQTGCRVLGHPWPKPLRFRAPEYPGAAAAAAALTVPPVGVPIAFGMEGEDVHEVAVGPVHAGVIEPGHFRFQCTGETVHHLEIALGYQHRGLESRLVGGPDRRTLSVMQTIAGDTSIGHGLAYCQLHEALAGIRVPPRAQAIRGVALELERLANHTGDLGALAGDVGFLPTQNYCGAIRGDFLNMTALIGGNRLGRGILTVGGVLVDLEASRIEELRRRLDKAEREVTGAVELLFQTPSVTARFEGTGVVSPETAAEIGLVGPAARACGLARDVRHDFPLGIYQMHHLPIGVWGSGDVFARAAVRWLEMQQSLRFVREVLGGLPGGPVAADATAAPIAPNRLGAVLVEGWRGQICHVAITDAAGRFARYKVVDPSFHNWFGLALCLRGQAISDFPLCNKSFNLSYCGVDL